jgi:hypothetical protein
MSGRQRSHRIRIEDSARHVAIGMTAPGLDSALGRGFNLTPAARSR